MKTSNILILMTVIAAVNFAHIASAESLKGSRPNIILVMTDDQGMGDLSVMGNQVLQTPNIDAFSQRSTRFNDFHVSPTCAPTRAALMSGRHEFRNGVTHTIRERERMALSTTTFAQLLQQSGYQTGLFGKWHLGDEQQYLPQNRGFSEVFMHGAGGIGQSFPGSGADFPPNQNKENKYFDNVILHNDTVVQTKGFCTDVFFQAALGWIKQQHDAKQPFFAYISTNAPHGPMLAPEKYKQRFKDMGWDDKTQGRYGMIENIDDNFGLLMQKLQQWQLIEDTLVIFMTDNGQAGRNGKLNGKNKKMHMAGFKTGKGSAYEGGTHVPAFWRWPGVLAENVDINALTAHIDLFKTFTELAGAKIPNNIQQIDGRSLLPLLENPKSDWPDREIFVHKGRWASGSNVEHSKYKKSAVRTQRWRLVNNSELYDINNDPFEDTDVAKKYPEVVQQLRTKYDSWWQQTVPLMVNEDAPLLDHQPFVELYEKAIAGGPLPLWQPPKL
ncbi:arylsulfatase [Thalassotalea fonticola]|uniref:Arylsulfatase n=1 Tax=Thalassotalea fonticola TaxID=3065649 RepID=A0ABZ0GUP6_9GAMM|nr:arylsulfatase [Colwelliaceae bacterium S1-1]